LPGTGFAVGNCACVVVVREGLADGLDLSVTVAGDLGLGPGLTVVRRGFCVVVVVRRWAFGSDGVTVVPGLVTESDCTVVVVVVVSLSLLNCRRTN
jgi:hypothetical protein